MNRRGFFATLAAAFAARFIPKPRPVSPATIAVLRSKALQALSDNLAFTSMSLSWDRHYGFPADPRYSVTMKRPHRFIAEKLT